MTRFFATAGEQEIEAAYSRLGRSSDAIESVGALSSKLDLSRKILRPLVAHDLRWSLRQYLQILEATRRPWPERIDAVLAATQPGRTIGRSLYPFSSMIYSPGGGWYNDNDTRWAAIQLQFHAADLAGVRAARIAVAIERYRRAHQGQLPADLGALVPAYLDALPIDPFSGKPLLYVVDVRRFTVYSVGLNRTDDRGVGVSLPHVVPDPGWGRRPRMTGDIGVQIVR